MTTPTATADPVDTDAEQAVDEASKNVKDAPQKKKDPRAEAKAARAAQRGKAAQSTTQAEEDDPLKDKYGDSQLVQSRQQSDRVWSSITACSPEQDGQTVLLRGRVHSVRGKGKSCFVILRQQTHTIQALMFVNNETVSKGMVKYASNLAKESIVDVSGKVFVPKEPVQGCSQSQVEIHVTAIHCISRAGALPFEVLDAGRHTTADQAEGDGQFVTVSQDLRLNHRVLDLRTAFSQAVFRLQSAVCQLFRKALLDMSFQEIHSPKLIGGASEGGSAVFTLQYFGQPACLAQSPQFYKQMAIAGDMQRVFEIGPVFRAETSWTHRHMCEFTGLDFEMEINEHYFEVLDVVGKLFTSIFQGLQDALGAELEVIQEHRPVEPFQWLPKTLHLDFAEGIKMLQAAGREVDPMGDLNTEDERVLGRLVKEKHQTDFYILYRYPLAVRPFYTMPDPKDPQYSCSYDVFMRGEEIISGAQRVHDPALLAERAMALGIPVETIAGYLDSFKYGMPPHGGAGVGLERVVMLFCGLDNIRKTSLFPRDPKRLSP